MLNDAEAAVIRAAEGGTINKWIKTKVNYKGDRLIDQFTAEAAASVKANPLVSNALENTDYSQYETYFARYSTGGPLYKANNRR